MKKQAKEALAFIVFVLALNVFAVAVVGGVLWFLLVHVPWVERSFGFTAVYVSFFVILGLINYFLAFRGPKERTHYGEFKSVAFFQLYRKEEFRGLVREVGSSPKFRPLPYVFFSIAFIGVGAAAIVLDTMLGPLICAFFVALTIYMWVNRARLIKVAAAFFIGSGLIGMGKPDEALAVAAGALRLRPRNVGGHWLMGNAYMAKGDFAAAVDAYEKAITYTPRAKALLLPFIGLSYHNMGGYTRAKKAYTEALRHNPTCMEAHYGMASVLAREDDSQTALSHLDRALALGYGDRDHIEHDDDFAAIRDDARFKELLDRHFPEEDIGDSAEETSAEEALFD
jgi:hypothetical protein